jgi:hypothetical protein
MCLEGIGVSAKCLSLLMTTEYGKRNMFYPIDADVILKLKPSRRLEEDVLAWQPEKSGSFSVRSAYKLAVEIQANGHGAGQSCLLGKIFKMC